MWCAGGDICFMSCDISTRGVWATRRALATQRTEHTGHANRQRSKDQAFTMTQHAVAIL